MKEISDGRGWKTNDEAGIELDQKFTYVQSIKNKKEL